MSWPLKAFISVSVFLNLLLAGVVIGNMGHAFMGHSMHRSARAMAAMLPEDKREHFESVMGEAEQDNGPLRQKISEARLQATQLLKANPFDKAAYLVQMQQVQQLHMQIMQHMVEAIAGWAAQSSPEERAALADALHQPTHSSSDE